MLHRWVRTPFGRTCNRLAISLLLSPWAPAVLGADHGLTHIKGVSRLTQARQPQP